MRSRTMIVLAMITLGVGVGVAINAVARQPQAREGEVAVALTGGHDTDPRDGGRPVVLIAAALGVADDVFRDAFTHVRPAHGGGGPTREEAQQNKRALLSRLEKYGVTNERLDEVSNYYRYRPQNGELWTHRDAVVFASVKRGVVTALRVADAGAGYSSPPVLILDGQGTLSVDLKLSFETALAKNGSIKSVTLSKAASTQASP